MKQCSLMVFDFLHSLVNFKVRRKRADSARSLRKRKKLQQLTPGTLNKLLVKVRHTNTGAIFYVWVAESDLASRVKKSEDQN